VRKQTDLQLRAFHRCLTADSNVTLANIQPRKRDGEISRRYHLVAPHVTNEIITVSNQEVQRHCTIEVDGTVGDIEGQPLLEAAANEKRRRTRQRSVHPRQLLLILLNLSLKRSPPAQRKRTWHRYSADVIICRGTPGTQSNTTRFHFSHVEPSSNSHDDDTHCLRCPLVLEEEARQLIVIARFKPNRLT
jgi:CTP synthase (UTP-ammonia lyase)